LLVTAADLDLLPGLADAAGVSIVAALAAQFVMPLPPAQTRSSNSMSSLA
jgi:hypothetical protein